MADQFARRRLFLAAGAGFEKSLDFLKLIFSGFVGDW